MRGQGGAISQTDVIVQVEKAQLEGNLARPEGANALVLFAHGSGSSRHSPRNRSVAAALNEAGLAAVLILTQMPSPSWQWGPFVSPLICL
jgi:putative phosphoribosyl transferase